MTSKVLSRIDEYFGFAEAGTNLRTETIAGATTFMTMAYIIVVNPAILSNAAGARMNFGAVMTATCVASAFATLLMAVLARYPIALAPGMGLNAFFSFEVCNFIAGLQARGEVAGGVAPWQIALGMVFISGFVFTALTFLKVREMIIHAVPECLKHGIAGGIGLFIAFIGLEEAGLIADHPVTFVQLGSVTSAPTLLALVGLAITAILMARRVRGAIFLGIVATGLLGIPLGIVEFGGVISTPPSPSAFAKLRINDALVFPLIAPILMMLFVDMFDTIGTLIGVAGQGGFLRDGRLPRATRALTADALGTVFGSIAGTSTVTSYIESAAGVSEGGRTGFASVVTAGLFLLALFFSPLVTMFGASVPSPLNPEIYLRPVTAPALILVGFLMLRTVRQIAWDDVTEGFPAFVTIIAMPLTFSIATGFSAGFVAYPLVKTAAGKAREVHPLAWALAALFLARYVFLPIRL
ncbi:MAG: NCS2 family permease [Deltaproteobacteria bacterium]|nr:NCS2 family permease [bacterium]MCB9488561.1 NCS2 family permease [Deltaproteobacteria bacterium]